MEMLGILCDVHQSHKNPGRAPPPAAVAEPTQVAECPRRPSTRFFQQAGLMGDVVSCQKGPFMRHGPEQPSRGLSTPEHVSQKPHQNQRVATWLPRQRVRYAFPRHRRPGHGVVRRCAISRTPWLTLGLLLARVTDTAPGVQPSASGRAPSARLQAPLARCLRSDRRLGEH